MAASEHTPHMQLSQFGPNDRPSWIDDYNKDMRTIDTALTQGGEHSEPLFCTAQSRQTNFTVSTETPPYRGVFVLSEGNITVDYNTHTIPITKSGYYAVSGYAEVSNVTLESGDDKTLILDIGKYSESGGYEIYFSSEFNKSYETREIPDFSVPQLHSCSITPSIIHLNAGDSVTMVLGIPDGAANVTLHGHINTMYLTIESKTFDSYVS